MLFQAYHTLSLGVSDDKKSTCQDCVGKIQEIKDCTCRISRNLILKVLSTKTMVPMVLYRNPTMITKKDITTLTYSL